MTPTDKQTMLIELAKLTDSIVNDRPLSIVLSWIDWNSPELFGYSFGHPVMCDALAMNIVRMRLSETSKVTTLQ